MFSIQDLFDIANSPEAQERARKQNRRLAILVLIIAISVLSLSVIGLVTLANWAIEYFN